MKRILLIATLFVSLLLASCATTPTEVPPPHVNEYSNSYQLSDIGLFGRHDLRTVEQTSQMMGSFSGHYFILMGGVDGKIQSTSILSFSWSPIQGRIYNTELPKSKIVVYIDNELPTPQVEFVFSDAWLRSSANNPYDTFDGRYLYPETAKEDLNNFIASWGFVLAKVYISETQLSQEPSLPH